MSATPSKDHVARGLSRLIQKYKGKPRFEGLLSSYLRRVQELEDAIWEVIEYRLLTNAEGYQLDRIGRIVGRGRNNLSDRDYLIAIRGQIRINRSSGTPEDMIAVTMLSLPEGFQFTFAEGYPASEVIAITTPAIDFNINVLFANLVAAKCGGVRLFLEYSLFPDSDTFFWSDDSTTHADTRRGWGDLSDPSIGGHWPSLLVS